jgi:sarcosine oxidase
MTQTYDVIVVGLGAMGSAATYHLARRGVKVLGIEMFQPGHDQGSSHGNHRMFRTSQVQSDGYVPLGKRTIELWHELQEEAGADLIHTIGEVHLRDISGDTSKMATVERLAADGFWEILDNQSLAERFPGFRLHDGMIATYEAEAGFVRSERGIITHVEMASKHGATIHTGEEVTGWAVDGDGVRVETKLGSYVAGRLVITAGPFSEELLRDQGFPMQVHRAVNGYFQPERPDWWQIENGAPNFLLSVPEGSFYGIPSERDTGLKLGLSAGGVGELTTARTIRRSIDDDEIQFLRDVLNRYMPGSAGPELKRITCMSTYTVDDGFILDRHPEHSQVSIMCGCCGRGFKFSPVIGEILAHLALDQDYPIDTAFMSANRFSAGVAAD